MNIYSTTKTQDWFQPQTITAPNAIPSSLTLLDPVSEGFEGFGGCFNELSQLALLALDETDRATVLDHLFATTGDSLHLSFCRIPIGASDYAEIWYSHNECDGDYQMSHFSIERDQKYLLPYIKEAQKRNPNLRFFASPWSPPTWMKQPKAYNFGTLVWTPQNLAAYALYLLKFVLAYENEGVHIDQIHVQNEPMSSQKFPSCIWTGEQFAEFIGKYLGPLFAQHHLTTKIWLGTINGPETDERSPYTRYNNYANLVLHDQDAYPFVEGISYQWAGKYALQQTRAAFPEKKIMQSENECGNGTNTWEYAQYIFELYQHYLSNGVCAYVYWNMVLQPKGKSTWGWEQNSLITVEPDRSVHYNHEYFVMKHFSHFIAVGAKRIPLSGHLASNAVAFQNPDASVIVVVQNPFQKPITFSLNGSTITLPADSISTITNV